MSVDRKPQPGESVQAYVDRVIVGVVLPVVHDAFVMRMPTFFEPSYVFNPCVLRHHGEKLWEPLSLPVF